jgi:hypothetical protein
LDSGTDSRKSDETRVVTPKGWDFLGTTNEPHVQQEIASREKTSAFDHRIRDDST